MKSRENRRKLSQLDSDLDKVGADVAYFDARLALLGRPRTAYQLGQRKAYRCLEGLLIEQLIFLREQELELHSPMADGEE